MAGTDSISREDAINAITLKLDMIDHVPYWVFDQLTDVLKKLPSTERVGHWINVNEGKWNTCEVLKCSACGEVDNRIYRSDKYCLNCGARMVSEDDIEAQRDYEAAVDQMEHDILYEPTYSQEDGSM